MPMSSLNTIEKKNLNKILNWLKQFGLEREEDDLEPMTDWSCEKDNGAGALILAGRHAQWNYYWSDDCVLRGRQVAEYIG